jgi:hypothetical protein
MSSVSRPELDVPITSPAAVPVAQDLGVAITEMACGSDRRVGIVTATVMPSDFPWPDEADPEFPLLSLVDPYGHTYWSDMQLRGGLMDELERLQSRLTTDEQREHLASVRNLATRVMAEGGGHWYLTFHGD